jgi:ADP-ribose pyrophosphatase YjhB (NUDIX family)
VKPIEFFNHCPQCGTKQGRSASEDFFECATCGFAYFINAGAAVAAFVQGGDGRWLFIRRAKEPGKGNLAPPGGFIDIGETAEDAAHREVREELGIELSELRFICSEPNTYLYREVSYPTLDLFFTARLAPDAQPRALEDVASFGWFQASEVKDLAFPSMQAAWRKLRSD